MILFIMAGCVGCKQDHSRGNKIITVDVTEKYQKKELILQDFMDVEYIPLETNDDFLTTGFVEDIGEDIIIVSNRWIQNGDIFIFDRKGKGLKKINRMGQGGEEYLNISTITLDENNGEIFVNDDYKNSVLVYDLDGNFKRNLKHREDIGFFKIYNFDKDNLICYDGRYSNAGIANDQSFLIISKQDGSITKEIQIPFEKKILTVVIFRDEATKMTYSAFSSGFNHPIIPFKDNWIITEVSSDTVYSYSSDHNMNPFITRTPSIQSMDPKIFLFLCMITDRYYFMLTEKKVYDFGTEQGFPSTNLMYDMKEEAIFEYSIYNDDYSYKQNVEFDTRSLNSEIASWQLIDTHLLLEDYRSGKLKGKLKEIAAELDEEDNSVVMLIKHKKTLLH